MPDEPDKARIVHVQQNTEGGDIDDYEIEVGWEVAIISGADRELLISKTKDGATDEFIAMYGQGVWLRAWAEETDDD